MTKQWTRFKKISIYITVFIAGMLTIDGLQFSIIDWESKKKTFISQSSENGVYELKPTPTPAPDPTPIVEQKKAKEIEEKNREIDEELERELIHHKMASSLKSEVHMRVLQEGINRGWNVKDTPLQKKQKIFWDTAVTTGFDYFGKNVWIYSYKGINGIGKATIKARIFNEYQQDIIEIIENI